VKISLIGAGSGVFSLGLIQNLCQTPNLVGTQVSFMDVDEHRLRACETLCRRYAQETGAKLRLEATLDRRQSLKSADFVVNTALPGAHHRMLEGMDIARQYGYRYNGSYHIMYDEAFWINFEQLRFFESLTEDILELCPDAWHLMVANPVFAGTTHLLRKYPDANMVGICHGYRGIYEVADVLGFEKGQFTYQIPGVNHFVWLTDFHYRGENAFPILDRWIETEAEKYWAQQDYPGGQALSPKAVDLYKTLGALPIGDTSHWTGSSWPWWYHTDAEVEKRWGEIDARTCWTSYVEHGRQKAAKMAQVAADESFKVSEAYPGRSNETLVELIESIACDIPRVFQGNNIMNTGELVPGLPTNVAVEVPTLVSRRGAQGIRTAGLPKPILAKMLHDRVAAIEMELEAFNRGSRELLLQLILMDKQTASRKQADDFLEEILALPYHADMRRHYR